MRQRQYLWVALACFGIGAWLITAMVGCAALGIGQQTEESLDKAYTVAIVSFAALSKDYNDAYDQAPPAVQAKWAEQISPRVVQAREALRIWRDAKNSTDAKAAADAALADMVALLVEVGLVQLE